MIDLLQQKLHDKGILIHNNHKIMHKKAKSSQKIQKFTRKNTGSAQLSLNYFKKSGPSRNNNKKRYISTVTGGGFRNLKSKDTLQATQGNNTQNSQESITKAKEYLRKLRISASYEGKQGIDTILNNYDIVQVNLQADHESETKSQDKSEFEWKRTLPNNKVSEFEIVRRSLSPKLNDKELKTITLDSNELELDYQRS